MSSPKKIKKVDRYYDKEQFYPKENAVFRFISKNGLSQEQMEKSASGYIEHQKQSGNPAKGHITIDLRSHGM